MSLRQIPLENHDTRGEKNQKKQTHFNPGTRIRRRPKAEASSLKSICLRLVHYINRGSKFTYAQIDELIAGMQHGILNLQKKKQDLLKKKDRGDGRK